MLSEYDEKVNVVDYILKTKYQENYIESLLVLRIKYTDKEEGMY